MAARQWRIGITGTFDLQNYGDLLFPLLAEKELRGRLGEVTVVPYSYHSRSTAEWPYEVRSLSDLEGEIGQLDGLLIGGGFLVRFDKDVAPGYAPRSRDVHHPIGFWLMPALRAAASGIPVAWNAPGMHCNPIPSWATPLLELAFRSSPYIAMRDELSAIALAPYARGRHIAAVPDTGFAIGRLFGERTAETERIRSAAGLTRPYIIVQSARLMEWFLPFLARNGALPGDMQVLALPISPVMGERPSVLGNTLPGVITLAEFPHPLVTAELIAGAEGVVGHSYHLAITALSAGVPVFTPASLSSGKFTALAGFDTVHSLETVRRSGPEWFFSRLGRRAREDAAAKREGDVMLHWDAVVAALTAGHEQNVDPGFMREWEKVPIHLKREEAWKEKLLSLKTRAVRAGASRLRAAFTLLQSSLRS